MLRSERMKIPVPSPCWMPRRRALGRRVCLWLLIGLAAGGLSSSFGQQKMTPLQLVRETSDPTSDLWYLYTELSLLDEPYRSFDRVNQFTLELQPSLPIPLTHEWRLLNFPDLALISQGTPDGFQISGVQSLSWTAAFSRVTSEFGWAYGLGPYVSFPATTPGGLGASLWQTGVGGVVTWRSETNLASTFFHAGWTTSDPGANPAGSLEIQYNLQHFFKNGTQVGLGRPRIEYTWDRNGNGGWTIPVGLDVARVFHIGNLPVKIMLEYEFVPVQDSRWNPGQFIRVTFLPVVPGPFKEPLFD